MSVGNDRDLEMRSAECEALRARVRELIAENDALRRIAGLQRAEPPTIPATPSGERAPFDWRHVLHNLHFGWPEDVIAEAKALRDAEGRGI